jgi:hypothetical protein
MEAGAAPALQGAVAGCRCLAFGDAGLVKVIEAWPRLPVHIRLVAIALVGWNQPSCLPLDNIDQPT